MRASTFAATSLMLWTLNVYILLYYDPKMKIMRYFHGQKEGDRVLNIVDAVRPIAQAVFAFESPEELEEARVNISESVYAVLKE